MNYLGREDNYLLRSENHDDQEENKPVPWKLVSIM